MTVTRIAGAFLLLTILGTLLLAFMASERGNMPLCWFLSPWWAWRSSSGW